MTQTLTPEVHDIAAGLLLGGVPESERAAVVADARAGLARILGGSAVWVPGRLPADPHNFATFGDDLPRYRPVGDLSPDEAAAIAEAWSAVLAEHVPGERQFLRLRVDNADDVRRLRELETFDGLELVPSLDSPGGNRGFQWRWPFRVGVLPGPAADEWLDAVRTSGFHGTVFDAELYDAAARYEIVLADAPGLSALTADAQVAVAAVPCLIVAGEASSPQLPSELDLAATPAIAVAFAAHPSRWWGLMFDVMAHDSPLDVAVEVTCRMTGVDALCSGPLRGLDVTAPMRWFAAVAPGFPDLAGPLADITHMDWTHEAGGASATAWAVRGVREHGEDPTATVAATVDGGGGPVEAAIGDEGWAEAEPPVDEPEAAMVGDDEPAFEEPEAAFEQPEAAFEEPEAAFEEPENPMADGNPMHEAAPPPDESPEPPAEPQPRRLVARVRDGDALVESVLPPQKELKLLVRVAIPEKGDIADRTAAFATPAGAGPTVELEAVVSGDVWAKQPPPQKILLSRERPEQASTWAAFPFTTPQEGDVVNIEITLFYQGKPLQAATYVSPVRAEAVDPDDRPTLTVHNLSGPDEPTDDLRPVAASLDGTGAQLTRKVDSTKGVLLTQVQDILDSIEEIISRVTADDRASQTLDDPESLKLLITLARIGVQLQRKLRPLALDDAPSIDVMVADSSPIFPLELAYAGPAPLKDKARLCEHVAQPPPPGTGCDKVSDKIVCPYAFWGLHRTISRTVRWDGPPLAPEGAGGTGDFSVLYASTAIADEGADAPVPGDQVLAAAKKAFKAVKRVKTWKTWRKEIERRKPRLLVILGHAVVVGNDTSIFIGSNSSIAGVELTGADLVIPPSPRPLVLLIACKSAVIGNAFGTLPGLLTAEGAGAVVGTLATITGPAGATAAVHLLQAFQEAAGTNARVGDVVANARLSLLAEKRLMGLILVSHGELDTKVAL